MSVAAHGSTTAARFTNRSVRLVIFALVAAVVTTLLPAGIANATPVDRTVGEMTGDADVAPMVIDGREAASARGMVAIYRRDGDNRFTCSGTLIARSWVLTARHCLRDAKATDFYVHYRSLNRKDGGLSVTVDAVKRHPNVDIGLLHLFTPAVDFEPMRLATHNPTVGAINKVKGWGCTEYGDDKGCPPAVRLRSARVKVTDLRAGHMNDGRKHQVWSEEETGMPCWGDSGGAQLRLDNGCQNAVISMVLDIQGCRDVPGFSDVKAISVPTHLTWIRHYVPGAGR